MKTVSKNQNNKKINLPYSSNELYLNLFLDWANSNPELFDNKYPELSEGLTREINSHPELLAAMIEKVPQLFPIWLDKADKLIGTAKINELKNIAGILEKIIKKELNDEIMENSRIKMIPIAEEYLNIIKSLLDPQEEHPRNRIGFKRNEERH